MDSSARASTTQPGEHGHRPSSGGSAGGKLSELQTLAGRRSSWGLTALFWGEVLAVGLFFVLSGLILQGFYDASGANLFAATFPGSDSQFAIELAAQGAKPLGLWWQLALGCVTVVFLARFFAARLETGSRVEQENQLRLRVLSAVFAAGPGRVRPEAAGRIMSLGTTAVEKFARYSQGFLPRVRGSFSAPLILLALMALFVHPLLAGLLLLCLPLIPLCVLGFMKLFRRAGGDSAQARSELATAYLDALSGLTTLRLLGSATRLGEYLEAVGERNRQATMRLLRSNQLVILVLDGVFSLFAVISAALLLLWLVSDNAITLGQAFTGLALSVALLEPINHFGSFFYVALAGRGSGRGILGFLGGLSAARNTQGLQAAQTETQTEAETKAASGRGRGGLAVELRGLDFSYGQRQVLQNVNLEVKAGEILALVGPSGSGKTTLLHLIKGFLHPGNGKISVCGHDKNFGGESALVSQDTWLFTGTIRENLAVVAPGGLATSEAQLWSVLRVAHLESEVRALPDALDTVLGENGAGLSSGQRQRLSLARALLSGRRLLLLDEATSQVDLGSEREILAALTELGSDHTLVMVTHRRALIELAHRVLRVENGTVAPV